MKLSYDGLNELTHDIADAIEARTEHAVTVEDRFDIHTWLVSWLYARGIKTINEEDKPNE